MNIQITRHAKVRMQQRGVSRDALGLLMKYGRRARAGKGAEIVYFDKRARRRLLRESDTEPRRPDPKQLNSYAVCKGAVILTAGRLYKRVRK
jgi:hypothetical protein